MNSKQINPTKNPKQFFYIVVKTDKKGSDERREVMGLPANGIRDNHITLFTIIAKNDKILHILNSPEFTTFCNKKVAEVFSGKVLNYKQNSWSFKGKGVSQFYTAAYELDSQDLITVFRTDIYKKLDSLILRDYSAFVQRQREVDLITQDYVAVDQSGQPWYATPAHSFGKNVWTPHLSIFNASELRGLNSDLYNAIVTVGPDHRKTLRDDADKIVFKYIGDNMKAKIGKGVAPMESIHFDNCIPSSGIH